jgi:hypothetical protein
MFVHVSWCAGGSKDSIRKMWDPIAYALGFLDCKDISARCMLSIFHFFATKTDASRLRMLNGSPRDRLLQPILDYITDRGGSLELRTGAACHHPSQVFHDASMMLASGPDCYLSCIPLLDQISLGFNSDLGSYGL